MREGVVEVAIKGREGRHNSVVCGSSGSCGGNGWLCERKWRLSNPNFSIECSKESLDIGWSDLSVLSFKIRKRKRSCSLKNAVSDVRPEVHAQIVKEGSLGF
jgi:hypothetical protein